MAMIDRRMSETGERLMQERERARECAYVSHKISDVDAVDALDEEGGEVVTDSQFHEALVVDKHRFCADGGRHEWSLGHALPRVTRRKTFRRRAQSDR
jgi:hypothetical protein